MGHGFDEKMALTLIQRESQDSLSVKGNTLCGGLPLTLPRMCSLKKKDRKVGSIMLKTHLSYDPFEVLGIIFPMANVSPRMAARRLEDMRAVLALSLQAVEGVIAERKRRGVLGSNSGAHRPQQCERADTQNGTVPSATA